MCLRMYVSQKNTHPSHDADNTGDSCLEDLKIIAIIAVIAIK